MPTYEYHCPNEHDFELFQRMSDPAEAKCPVCGADAQRMLSGGAGLIFKGSGFYITDYRSDSYKKSAESDTGSSGSAGKPVEPKTEGAKSEGTKSESSKPDAKPESKSSSPPPPPPPPSKSE